MSKKSQNIIFFTLIKLNILPPTHFLFPISFMEMSKKSPSKHHFLHLDKTKHDDCLTHSFFPIFFVKCELNSKTEGKKEDLLFIEQLSIQTRREGGEGGKYLLQK